MRARLLPSLLIVVVASASVTACTPAGTGLDSTDPGAVVEEAAYAFARGFSDRDLSQLDTFFAPAADGVDTSNTLDAANSLLTSMPLGTHIEIASFTVDGVDRRSGSDQAVVSYDAVLRVALPGDAFGSVEVIQSVSLELQSDQWLIVKADPAQVTGQMPQPESG